MSKETITLDQYESQWAMHVGYYRHHESERRHKTQTDGSKASNALDNHRRGAAAELALSKFLALPWNATVNTYNSFPDLDGQMEVRSKPNQQPYMRIKQKTDNQKPHYIFVSVSRLGNRQFRIDGWIIGSDAMQQKYLVANDPNSKQPEWHVPLDQLNNPSTLNSAVAKRIASFRKARKRFQDELRTAVQK